jgi:hypothetical protein
MATSARILALSVGVLSFIVYILTLAPTITWRNNGVDSGDLATAVAIGGVPHPSGYPTYLILGQIFNLLPFGDTAYRLNLLSATGAAFAVALMSLGIYHTLPKTIYQRIQAKKSVVASFCLSGCALSATLALAFSGLFWSQAVITEVYALNAFFAALLFYGALRVKQANQHWLLPGLCGLLGLSLGNHLSILLWLPFPIFILKARWRWQPIAVAFLAFCIGLSTYSIIPWRAAALPPVNWGLAITWSNFLWLVSAEPYRQFVLATPWSFTPSRILVELRLLTETFIWWGIPVGLLGLSTIFQTYRALAYGSLLTFILFSIYAIGYNTTDSFVYLLPALLIFSLWIGWGLYSLLDYFIFQPATAKPAYIACAILVFVGTPLLSLWLNFSKQNLSQDYQALAYAQQSLDVAEPGAIIITDDDPHTFALWYGRYALNIRPDVVIVNINLLSYGWYRQILNHNHPAVKLTGPTNQPLTTLSAFVTWNLSAAPLYLSTTQATTLAGYKLKAMGHLQQIIPTVTD